jgi:hypothetical protein
MTTSFEQVVANRTGRDLAKETDAVTPLAHVERNGLCRRRCQLLQFRGYETFKLLCYPGELSKTTKLLPE